MNQKFTSTSVEQTWQIATDLASKLKGGELVGLVGDLGAGKTEFVRGFVSHFGIENSEVNSPSFVLENLYETSYSGSIHEISHWDLYRVSEGQMPEDLYDYKGNMAKICLVEWSTKSKTLESILDYTVIIQLLEDDSRSLEIIPNS